MPEKTHDTNEDPFRPHPKDEMADKFNSVEYDGYGHIYLLSKEDVDVYDYDFAPDLNVIRDNQGYISTFSSDPISTNRIRQHTDSAHLVSLIKGTENMQTPRIERPPRQKGRAGVKSRNQQKFLRTTPGARRFDQFAPNSKERVDFMEDVRQISNDRLKVKPAKKAEEVSYIDYFYY